MQNNLFLFHQRKIQKCYKSVGADNLCFHFCVKQRIDEEEHPTLHQVKDFIPRYVIY